MPAPETPHSSSPQKPGTVSVRPTALPKPAIATSPAPKSPSDSVNLPTPSISPSMTRRPTPASAPVAPPSKPVAAPSAPTQKPASAALNLPTPSISPSVTRKPAPAPSVAPKPTPAPTAAPKPAAPAPRKATPALADLPTPSMDPTLTMKPTIGEAPRPKAAVHVAHRPVVHVSPRAMPEPSADSAATTVLPPRLSEETARFFQQALHPTQIDKGFLWILEKMSAENDPPSLASQFMKRYEEQIVMLRGAQLDAEGSRPAFRAALVATVLRELPRYRLRFANRTYNAVFLETWLKKQLLAAILGLSPADIERKIFLSGRTAPVFINGELQRVLHTTFLAGILK